MITLPICPRCLRVVSLEEIVGNRVIHRDCPRTGGLPYREWRRLLFYCSSHEVAKCPSCGRGARQHELNSNMVGDYTCVCPKCRTDLTEAARSHLYICGMLPREVRRRSLALCRAAADLLRESRAILETSAQSGRD